MPCFTFVKHKTLNTTRKTFIYQLSMRFAMLNPLFSIGYCSPVPWHLPNGSDWVKKTTNLPALQHIGTDTKNMSKLDRNPQLTHTPTGCTPGKGKQDLRSRFRIGSKDKGKPPEGLGELAPSLAFSLIFRIEDPRQGASLLVALLICHGRSWCMVMIVFCVVTAIGSISPHIDMLLSLCRCLVLLHCRGVPACMFHSWTTIGQTPMGLEASQIKDGEIVCMRWWIIVAEKDQPNKLKYGILIGNYPPCPPEHLLSMLNWEKGIPPPRNLNKIFDCWISLGNAMHRLNTEKFDLNGYVSDGISMCVRLQEKGSGIPTPSKRKNLGPSVSRSPDLSGTDLNVVEKNSSSLGSCFCAFIFPIQPCNNWGVFDKKKLDTPGEIGNFLMCSCSLNCLQDIRPPGSKSRSGLFLIFLTWDPTWTHSGASFMAWEIHLNSFE
ncbi:hypothetical protein VP01_463g4 [Puccinia sorghi]|uniref:Uncharacterized protein n=1 Tax=Puccinia sorghi TaxID=27349 RepID=A0A0L6UNB8_9BASI|nr:hypothetical protein VP01_463g4 [Puccinia sorghi]